MASITIRAGRSNMDKAMGSEKSSSSGPMKLDDIRIAPRDITLDGKKTTVYELNISMCKKDSSGNKCWGPSDCKTITKTFTSVDEAAKCVAEELGASPVEEEEMAEDSEVDTESEEE